MELEIVGFGVVDVPDGEDLQKSLGEAVTAFHANTLAGQYFDLKPRAVRFNTRGDVGSIEPIEPTLRQRVLNRTIDLFTSPNDDGATRIRRVNLARKVVDALNFLPGIGESMDASQAAREFQDRNYLDAAILAGATAIGVVPVLGDAGREALQSPLVRDRIGEITKKIDAYAGSHRAPSAEFGAPMHDISRGGEMYPEDVYSSDGLRIYGDARSQADRESYQAILSARNNPDELVTIYRAVPRQAEDVINAGDWVTPSRSYAEAHGLGPLNGDYKILEMQVPARQVYTNADSLNEFGYDPLAP